LFEGSITTRGRHFGAKIFLRFVDDYSRYDITYSDAQHHLDVKDAWITINSSDPDNIQFSILLEKEKLDSLLPDHKPQFKKARMELVRKRLMVLGESACEDLISLIMSEQQEEGSSDSDIDYMLLQTTLSRILGPHVAANILRSIENDILGERANHQFP
jgi:hypothetical protein